LASWHLIEKKSIYFGSRLGQRIEAGWSAQPNK
jgi:hypothetical protein